MIGKFSIPIWKVAAGVGGVSFGGVAITYGTGGFGGGKEGKPKSVATSSIQKIQSLTAREEAEFKTVDEFKQKQGGACFKNVFAQNSWNDSGAQEWSPPSSDSSDYFGSPESGSTKDGIHGCLSIQTKHEVHTDQGNKKWYGSFSWVWAFKNGSKGFIVFGFAEAKEKDKLDVLGAVYFLSYESGTWNIKHKKEVKDKTINSSDFPTKFPKRNSALTFTQVTSMGDACWDWPSSNSMSDNSGTSSINVCEGTILNHIQSAYASSNPQGRKHLLTWSQNPADGAKDKKISGWCEKLDWWKHLFDENDAFQLETKLNSFSGKWTLQSQ